MKKINKKKLIINIIIILLINIFTNYNYFLSLFNKTTPIIYNQNDITLKNNNYYIENINKNINMIEINFTEIPSNITISYTDKYFKYYDHLNKSYEKKSIKKDKIYIFSSTGSKIKNLKFELTNGKIKNIILNPKVKFNLTTSIISTTIYLLILTIITYLKSKINLKNNKLINKIKNILNLNIIPNNKLDLKNKKHKLYIIITISILTILSIFYYILYIKTRYEFGDLYESLYVDAIMNKKLELDYEVNQMLLIEDNPYDTSNRPYTFLWDASFYKGKYYCYFGIWPIITLFIPYKIITNTYLTSPLACLIYTILSIIGTYLIYKSIIKKYFKDIHLITYIISFIFIIFGTRLLWCIHRPAFYEVVSLAAYTNIIFGLYLTLFKNKKISNFIGYTLLASAVLCRPTSLICSLLIIPKLIHKIKNKQFKLIDFILLAIPYATIGLFTMYINYIRFDSIFEFGVSYQLTTNNLYNKNFSLTNAIYGAINYLFGKTSLVLSTTPQLNLIKIPYITDINIERLGGGIITTSILTLIIIFIPKIFKKIKEKELKIYISLSLIIAFSLIIISSGIGAIIGRYMLDFSYLFYFITVILWLQIIKNSKNKNIYQNIYLFLCLISILINFIISNTNVL